MAMPLKVENDYHLVGSTIMKVTGFDDRELSELNSMDYREMIETVLNALDERNNGLGSCWQNGYGVYTMWITDKSVMVEIGNSCD